MSGVLLCCVGQLRQQTEQRRTLTALEHDAVWTA